MTLLNFKEKNEYLKKAGREFSKAIYFSHIPESNIFLKKSDRAGISEAKKSVFMSRNSSFEDGTVSYLMT